MRKKPCVNTELLYKQLPVGVIKCNCLRFSSF